MDEGLWNLSGSFAAAFARDDPRAAVKLHERGNVESLQTFFAALAHKDYERAYALLCDDVDYVIYAAGAIPFQMTGHGRMQAQTGIRTNYDAIRFERVDIDTLAAQGDVVVVIARQRGTWLASQVSFDERLMLEYTFRDTKLSRYRAWILPGAP